MAIDARSRKQRSSVGLRRPEATKAVVAKSHFWPEFGGGPKHQDSFIERCKSLIDDLNADHLRGAGAPSDFTRTTLSMHFYDSIVVFEKGRHGLKRDIKTGGSYP